MQNCNVSEKILTLAADFAWMNLVSGPHDNFDKLPKKNRRNGNFVWSGAVILFYFFLFTDKKTRVGVDTGSVGLVETRVFF